MTEWARKHKLSLAVSFGLLVILSVLLTIVSEKISGNDTATCSDRNIYAKEHNVALTSYGAKKYSIELATTVSQQELGLSNRPCFPKNGALIFLFPTDDKFGIWMKNMKFPIDVVWLNKDKEIVTIEKNMQPNSYPKTFYPKSDSRYVIELNAGQADFMGLQENQAINW